MLSHGTVPESCMYYGDWGDPHGEENAAQVAYWRKSPINGLVSVLSTPFSAIRTQSGCVPRLSVLPTPLGYLLPSSLMLPTLYIYLAHLHTLRSGQETGIIIII